MQISRTAAAKVALVFLFTILWLMVDIVRAVPGAPETHLDDSALMAEAATLQQGSISGRDFNFTYGPLYQLFLYTATLIVPTHSAFDAFPLMTFMCHAAESVLFGFILLLIVEVDWKLILWIYPAAALLDLLPDTQGFRPALNILLAVLAYRTLRETDSRRQIRWAIVAGCLCFAEQLVTPELAVYGLAAILFIFGVFATRRFGYRRSSLLLALFLSPLAAGNLALDLAFRWSSPAYASLFDYQRYSFEIMRSYQTAAGLGWAFSPVRTLLLFIVPIFTLIAAVVIYRTGSSTHAALFVSLIVVALLSLKSSIVRSDGLHVLNGLTPFTFAFLVLPAAPLKRLRTVWPAMLCLLLLAWPRHRLTAAYDLAHAMSGTVLTSASQLISRHVAPDRVLAPELLDASYAATVPMLNFPYQDYIAILLKRPMLDPVLQSYAAGDDGLQRYFIEAMSRHEKSGLDLTYSPDGSSPDSSWAIDGVQTISRTPAIFEHILENFEPRSKDLAERSTYLLRPRAVQRDLKYSPLSYRVTAETSNQGVVALPEATPCGLLRMDLTISYPATAYLGKPAGIELRFDEQVTADPVIIAPIELGRPFATYFSLVEPANFYKVLTSETISSQSWRGFRYAPSKPDWLAVPPKSVVIESLQCVEPQLFIAKSRE